ncbi:RND efflux system, inner membrane transporter CmeB [Fimbriiglobus ruber]|uniref:RND efflux system, inner membrane transporter CmeB n=2 Tax=Fimbriiglobus ruber TaxID=1908690 RepID=A0A225EAJ5_9BACT|nr:RND efflux system, inner membrane transporter CmeB [Fimbriiglobus ruber]
MTLPTLLAVFTLSIPACGGSNAIPDDVIRVTASYPGANARVVADTVAAPIEQQVNGVKDVTGLESESRADGSYTLTVRFTPRTDLDMALVLVQNRVALANPILPEAVRQSGVTVCKAPDGPPAFWVAVTSPGGRYDERYLANYARINLVDEFARLRGATNARTVGAGEGKIRMWLDPEKLAAGAMTAADVIRLIEEQNIKVSTGRAQDKPLEFALLARGRFVDPDRLRDVILRATPNGEVIRLRDVARFEVGIGDGTFATVDGSPAALVAVTAWRGITTAAEVGKVVDQLAKRAPEDVRMEVVADVPADDSLVVNVRLPESASRERVQGTVAKISKAVRALTGVQRCTAFGDDREPNAATIFVKRSGEKRPAVADIRKALRDVPDIVCRVREAGREPLRFALCDAGDQGAKALWKAASAVVERMTADTAVVDVVLVGSTSRPEVRYTIDQTKLKVFDVSLSDVSNTLRVAVGVSELKGATEIDRTVVIQVPSRPGATRDDLSGFKVRNKQGQMVPLSAVTTVQDVEAESVVVRVNLHPAVILTTNPGEGVSPKEAIARCQKLIEEALPKGYRAENLSRSGR